MRLEDIKLQRANIEWIMGMASNMSLAVTLTLKPYRVVMTERGQYQQALTQVEAQQNFHWFLKRLNSDLFGNAAKRYGKGISVVPCLEGLDGNKEMHYHCAMAGFPEHLPHHGIAAKIVAAWHQTPFGNEQVNIQRMTTPLWIGYGGKDTGQYNKGSVDFINLRLPATSLT